MSTKPTRFTIEDLYDLAWIEDVRISPDSRFKVVELVRYPREGHELTRGGEPHHRADHLRRTLAWFNRYCRDSA